jgi:hypothetical protein
MWVSGTTPRPLSTNTDQALPRRKQFREQTKTTCRFVGRGGESPRSSGGASRLVMNGVMFIKCDGIVKNRWVMNMNIRLMNV